MAEKYVQGDAGKLYRWDSGAYRPIVCLTDTSRSATAEVLERINMCTEGKTERQTRSVNETIAVNGVIIDTTEVGVTPRETANDIFNLMYSQIEDGDSTWKLDQGPAGSIYFQGQVSDVSNNFAANEDATFSFNINVNSAPTTVDPNATPAG